MRGFTHAALSAGLLAGAAVMTLALPGCITMSALPVGKPPTAEDGPGVEVVTFESGDGAKLEGRMRLPAAVRAAMTPATPEVPAEPPKEDASIPPKKRVVSKLSPEEVAAIGAAMQRINEARRTLPEEYGRTVILFCHGVIDNNQSPMASFFSEAGFRVFSFDYRGFGNSEKKKLTNEGLAADAYAALQYLRSRPDVDPDRIVIYGHSMGGVYAMAAGALASESGKPVAGVISAGAFANWREVSNDMLPLFGLLLGGVTGPEPLDWAKRLGKTPLLVVHAEDDENVKPRYAKQIFDAAVSKGAPATLVLEAKGGHVMGYLEGPDAPLTRPMVEFATRVLAPKPADAK
ncbi:MAG: alpha/beta fold hydrolase [Phycisphaerales bacterium]|nr:alpha/beta fold hydrolase [Phycisphaerales bacterium]